MEVNMCQRILIIILPQKELNINLPYHTHLNSTQLLKDLTALLGSAWSLLSHSKLPNKLWAEVVVTAVYVRNHVTTCVNEEWITPFEKWYGHTQDVSHLRVFGCTAYCLFPVLKEESSTRRLNLCLITARTLSNWITTPRLLLLQS